MNYRLVILAAIFFLGSIILAWNYSKWWFVLIIFVILWANNIGRGSLKNKGK